MSLLNQEPSNQYQGEFNPDLSRRRMEDAKKYLPQTEYGTRTLEEYLANAGELIKQFESTADPTWLQHKAAIVTFLQVIKNPISSESLGLYKKILESKAKEKFDPYLEANRVQVDMSTLFPADENVPPIAKRVKVEPTSESFQNGNQE